MTSTSTTQPGSAPAAQPQRSLLARLMPHASIVLGLLAVLLIWAGAIASIARERAMDERAALQNADNLARAFEEQIIRSLRAADQALIYFRDSYERDNGQVDAALWARPYRALTDMVLQVAVADRNGLLVASTLESPEAVNLADREHFRVHAQRDTDELFISEPVVGRVSGRQSIQLTRRINAADGAFGGVAVLSVDPSYFTRFYETIDLGRHGSISLIGTDGVIRTHGSNGRRSIGNSIAGGGLMENFAHEKNGRFRAVSRADGVERFVNYREVRGYPLIVSVDLAVDEVFAEHYRTRFGRLLAAAFLTVVLVPLIILVIGYQRGLARARDEAEAGIRARAEFLAVMSHEIRTPMNAVLGFASTLLETKLDTEQRLAAGALHAAGDDLLRILNDILDFSRLDAGRIQFEEIPFSPAAVVESTISIVGQGASAKGLSLRVDLDPSLPPALLGDAGRLRQVLLNLLANAIKFTQHGEVIVTARCIDRQNGCATVQWSVADTGIGIAPDRIGGMFTDFMQADSSVNRRFGGSGLGLAICKRIVSQMGGRIGATSEPGHGSVFTFSVTLPVSALVPDTGPVDRHVAAELDAHIASLGRPLRILMAEDNPTNQLVGKQMLRDLDAIISVASNGAEAVQLANGFDYDLILMDMQMPEMNGLQATRAIRASAGPVAGIPIIALTANAYPEDVKACLDSGMNSFVAKPVRKAVLMEAILRALQGTVIHDAPEIRVAADVVEVAVADLAVLDVSVVEEFVEEIGAAPAGKLLHTYLTESRRRLATLRGLQAGEHEAIHLEAHTLKGSSGIFGLPRLSELARRLERRSASIGADEYRIALAELEEAFAVSERELSAYLAARTTGAGAAA